MIEKIEIKRVEQLTAAAVREVIPLSELSIRIPELLDHVYGFLKTSGFKKYGHNLAVYRDDKPTVDVGVIVYAEFENSDNIICTKTPEGRVAFTIHRGSYDKLPETHKAIHDWCTKEGIKLAGPCWEIYGDWNDNESKLTTEVYYLLES